MRKFIIVALAVLTAAGQQAPAPPPPAGKPAAGQQVTSPANNPVAGQQAPAPAVKPVAGITTFHTDTSLVVVDVTVKDKAGNLIEDLKARDFTLLEDGKPQEIKVFEFEKLSTDPAPPEAPPTLEDVNALPEAPVKQITSDKWGHYYRYICPAPEDPSTYLLFSCGPDGQEYTADDITQYTTDTGVVETGQ